MLLDLADYEIKACSAVKMFWSSKKESGTRKLDDGNMAGFIDLIADIVHANGLTNADIIRKSKLAALPGHFCSTQSWDLLVMNKGKLIAAVKFDSQIGPSLGKNANNCCDQAISLAIDFQAVYRRWIFGEGTKPFVGYLVLLEDSQASRRPVKDITPNFPLVQEYRKASYAERYDILCKKLIMEQLYTTATVITSPREAVDTGQLSVLSQMTSLRTLVTSLAGHVAAEAARLG
jgi:hypothetical protein